MKMLLLGALAGAITFAPARTPGYAGAWILDATQSKGLPPYYSQVRSHTLAVTQTESALTVRVVVVADRPTPDSLTFDYRLDGTETAGVTKVRGPEGMMSLPMKLKAYVAPDSSLHITITRELSMGERTMSLVGTEVWRLSGDGKTLTVDRVDQMPQGTEMRSQMVFVRR